MLSGMRGRQLRGLAGAVALAVLVASCSLTGGGNLLGGRDKCWPADPPRAASIWRGILAIDDQGIRLLTPEGDAIPLASGSVAFNYVPGARADMTDANGNVLAKAGDDVTLFGGAGADGYLVVCGLEELHAGE